MYRLYAKYLAPQETEGWGGGQDEKELESREEEEDKEWRAGKNKKIRSGK